MNAPDPNPLKELIAEAMEKRLEDPRFDLVAFARAHPESEVELLERLEILREAALLPGESLGEPGAPASVGIATNPEVVEDLLEALRRKPPLHERYEIRREIGRGGMGRVVEVFDRELRRTLALKFLRTPSSESVRREMVVRFLEEARITGGLNHQGIVPIHDLGIDEEGTLYYTMRLVEGRRTLREVFELARKENEDWTRIRALGAMLRACEAVSYAHQRGVVHRDLKPTNIMVGPLGEVFVVDWGLSKVLEVIPRDETGEPIGAERTDSRARSGDSPFVTGHGRTLGTPYYMSPEQARGDRDAISAKSDVYAMGAILYELLADHPPYAVREGRISSHQLVERICSEPPARIEEVAPHEPAELLAICSRAMERRPEDRFPSIAELAEDLRAFLEGRVVTAHETGAWAEGRKWVRRNKPLASTLAAALLTLVVGLAVSLPLKTRADAMASDVLQLAEAASFDDLVAEADRLQPALPEHIEAYREWMEKARGLAANLDRFRAKREELAAKALPLPTRVHEVPPWREHERWQLEALRDELEAKRGVYRQRTDGIPVPLPNLDRETLPGDVKELKGIAWDLVKPDRTRFGREAEGLRLLEYAWELRTGAGLNTLTMMAWASFALGRDEEALETIQSALDQLAPDDPGPAIRGTATVLEIAVDWLRGQEGGEWAREELEAVESRIAELEERNVHRSLQFSASRRARADRWWHDRLTGLIEALEGLEDKKTGLLSDAEDAVSTEHGWSVPRRLRFAERLRDDSAKGGEWDRLWQEATLAIREHPAYGELELAPQQGLVPLGPDPESRLWEFWHVATGVEPRREDGKLVPTEEMGLVLVLLPGGNFWMGAQNTDEGGRNYDPEVDTEDLGVEVEGPVHEVKLSPFFLSKYEMTQAQWSRLTGDQPSWYGPFPHTRVYMIPGLPASLQHPVEMISWFDCVEVLPQGGLLLPSEAQWEYAIRGGRGTTWFTGSLPESLNEKRAANLADQAWRSWPKSSRNVPEDPWDDGYISHAPVGTFTANPFGLHDVAGNVWEWCLDGYDAYELHVGSDPVNRRKEKQKATIRGAGWETPATHARSAFRKGFEPAARLRVIGVRPARALDP